MSFIPITNILFDNIYQMSKYLKRNPKGRKVIFIYCGVGLVTSAVSVVLNEIFFKNSYAVNIIYSLVAIMSFFLILIASLSYLVDDSKVTVNEHLENLAKEREELSSKLDEESNVMDVIKINLNQLNEYYTINKVQARRSYSLSMTMIVLGFIIIASSIALCFYGKISVNVTVIASISGVISEFIGATSLLLYKESNSQIQTFFDKLSSLQNTMLAVELTDRLENPKKDEKLSEIISSLVDKNNK